MNHISSLTVLHITHFRRNLEATILPNNSTDVLMHFVLQGHRCSMHNIGGMIKDLIKRMIFLLQHNTYIVEMPVYTQLGT